MSEGPSKVKVSKKLSQLINVIRAVLVSFFLGGNLAAITLLTRPSDAVLYVQYVLFAWRMVIGQGLKLKQFHELFPSPEIVPIDILPNTSYLTLWDANYTKDMIYLSLMARVLSPKTIFEIGTLHGYTSLMFARNTPPDTLINTLDLPADKPVESALATTVIDDRHIMEHATSKKYLYVTDESGKKVRQLYGDSATFDFTPFAKQVDLFFIDGAHSYEYVRSDTLNALACIRPGGVIVWHDYGRWGVNGVSKWLHELASSGRSVYRFPGSSLAILVDGQ